MSHARIKFIDALANDKDRTEFALVLFGQLLALEGNIADEGLSNQKRWNTAARSHCCSESIKTMDADGGIPKYYRKAL